MEEKTLILATVNFLMEGNNVWLATKSRKIGAGCRNGYGGGLEVEDNGNLITSCIREIEEECGVKTRPENFEKVAIIKFNNTKTDGTTSTAEIHAYLVKNWKGTPKETVEMLDPQLYDINNLPFSEMMPADEKWIPLVMHGKKLRAEYYYSPFQKELIDEKPVEIVNFLPD